MGKAVITSGAVHLNLDPQTGRGSCGNGSHIFLPIHLSLSPHILCSIAIWTAGLEYASNSRPGSRGNVLVKNAASLHERGRPPSAQMQTGRHMRPNWKPWSARKRPCHSLSAPQIGLERRRSQSKCVCVMSVPVQRVVRTPSGGVLGFLRPFTPRVACTSRDLPYSSPSRLRGHGQFHHVYRNPHSRDSVSGRPTSGRVFPVSDRRAALTQWSKAAHIRGTRVTVTVELPSIVLILVHIFSLPQITLLMTDLPHEDGEIIPGTSKSKGREGTAIC